MNNNNKMYNNCIKFIYFYIILFVFLYFIRFFNYHINYGKVFIKDLDNVIYINNNITHESVYDNLKTINHYIKLKKSSNINLYINSSSGNFDAGYLLISEMERLKKSKNIKFTCYAHNALYISFSILQYCNERYIDYSSVLHHEHKFEIIINDNINYIHNFVKYDFSRLQMKDNEIKEYISKKIKVMEYYSYTKDVNNGWTINFIELLIYNIVDKMVRIII